MAEKQHINIQIDPKVQWAVCNHNIVKSIRYTPFVNKLLFPSSAVGSVGAGYHYHWLSNSWLSARSLELLYISQWEVMLALGSKLQCSSCQCYSRLMLQEKGASPWHCLWKQDNNLEKSAMIQKMLSFILDLPCCLKLINILLIFQLLHSFNPYMLHLCDMVSLFFACKRESGILMRALDDLACDPVCTRKQLAKCVEHLYKSMIIIRK